MRRGTNSSSSNDISWLKGDSFRNSLIKVGTEKIRSLVLAFCLSCPFDKGLNCENIGEVTRGYSNRPLR